MADDEKLGEGTSTRGVDWEVVSLTDSTYAAAPGPKALDLGEGEDKENTTQEKDPSGSMYVSKHFVFPPSEHENLPFEPGYSEPDDHSTVENKGDETFLSHEDSSRSNADSVRLIDNENISSVYGMKLEEAKDSEGSDLVTEEQSIYRPSESGTIHDDRDDIDDSSQGNLNSPQKSTKAEDDEANLPCNAWWQRHAAYLYRHAKEASTFWSVAVAAAVLGLVILGRRWQREKLQLQHVRWHANKNDEKWNRVLGPIGRFVSGRHRHNPTIGGLGAYANP